MIKFLKFFFGTVFTILILIGSCVFYAFKIEPYRITSNQLSLNEKTSDFIKVVQFSDTHIKGDFTYKNLDISSTNLAKNYVSGMYELNSKTKIYVNTGIGTTHVSGRLGVVPEISIFHIYL